MDETESRLLELCERIETAALQARHELEPLRPKPDGYSDAAYRDLVSALDRLRDSCDQIRYANARDRLTG